MRKLIAATLLALCAGPLLAAGPATLRVGYQKSSVSMVLAREHHLFEQGLPGTKVEWIEFLGGPPLIEALNGGSIDIGNIGDIPPIFAQAAGIDIRYIGVEPNDGRTEAILLPKDSTVQSVAELKGKRVALLKGSSAHNLFLKSLLRAGLQWKDVNVVYLSPSDGRAAFEQGKVDAWVVWDPYYSAAVVDGSAKVLGDGQGLNPAGSFFIASGPFAKQYPQAIAAILKVFAQAQRLSLDQHDESVALMAKTLGLQPAVVESYFKHRSPTPSRPLNATDIATQQGTADAFFANGLIPKKVDVQQVVFNTP
ncbi:aliphatic sulfonate ABC transporter substrate-binding protein [Pseudomonas sp. CBSPBW29]|uniref:aliphatic sulfonate ABC transporter substrate-binding protein n=1 Tax=Pseudomonas TaxID=286 RepID=UPI0021AD09C5|nr:MULTISPECIES: aliphatic sulfonate ABC transporter substrate-binding protein [unclassified Pseudomonas]WEL41903.1 aliphatic sulfonate ABC transporter substrate-binding protein [Pseudomonas sp. CBSPBW29]WEL62967.1 aliphatic sulfonate ABC transporter substrate-binding protein [Pseudomonas sp. CBSPGW29]WEL72153.1 aliphatic sulfonate ABC transporter substrate-binding protein [Pseudomonas sp. CBSPCGW29]WEL79050.1 aliphatic sulfonate ABC transporter substrate-binding protein [Pseudomonas sp. CBSPAW